MSFAPDGVTDKVKSFIETTFGGQYEIYDVVMRSVSKRLMLQVFIDKPEGINIADCERVSRSLSCWLDEEDLIHRQYYLEVSSPGVERVLKREVDFQRMVGKLVKWTMRSSEEGSKHKVFNARLQEYYPDRVVVLTEKGTREVLLSEIEEARAVLEFPRKVQG
ncbi:MAG: ribosome maturation factor RimP [Candidatus Riflebacteria bacterium]|nr:ribosome maturation factor RimP [Candidatus Riflebacteria bacterium]